MNATVGCNCQAGAEPPALHGDNCPVLFRWLRQTIPVGEAEVATAAELHTLDTALLCPHARQEPVGYLGVKHHMDKCLDCGTYFPRSS